MKIVSTILALINRISALTKLFSAKKTHKIISSLLIIAYLMLPAICFGNPCETLSTNTTQGTAAPDASGESPPAHDRDNCETTCCCAGHVPLSAFSEIPYADLTAKLLPYRPQLALPRLIDRIFVPPQNHS